VRKGFAFPWSVPDNFLRAGWKAEPSSRRGGGGRIVPGPESQRLSAQQAAKPHAALASLANMDSPGL